MQDAGSAAVAPRGTMAEILVVLGAPRSGTTLVATALAAHPAVAMLMEDFDGAVFRLIGGKLPAVKLCTPNQIDLDHRRPWPQVLVGWNGWLRKRVGRRPPQSRLSLRDMAAKAELKVVCVLREPAANVAAMRRRERNRSGESAREVVNRTFALYEQLPSEPRMEARFLSFDRLVRDPESQLRRLCDWLGLPFDPAMLDAPRLNPLYPEATFRAERAAAAPDGSAQAADETGIAALRARHDALLARAL